MHVIIGSLLALAGIVMVTYQVTMLPPLGGNDQGDGNSQVFAFGVAFLVVGIVWLAGGVFQFKLMKRFMRAGTLGENSSKPAGPMTAASWNKDPYARHELRYFDGTEWTPTVSDGGVVSRDPQSAGPASS
ncbi:MAG: DUF2510 domain-containing protein [Actinomycetes bacterium]